MEKSKRELLFFLGIAFGLNYFMSILMFIFFHTTLREAGLMCFPAAGVMLAKLIWAKDDPLLPKLFFTAFLSFVGLVVVLRIISFFFPDVFWLESSYLTLPGAIILGGAYLVEKEEHLKAYQLKSQNWGPSFRLLLLFCLLILMENLLTVILTEGFSQLSEILSMEYAKQIGLAAVAMIPAFYALLGEEYGWRTYFQPLLQKQFGSIKGILFFGVFWSLWHLPADLSKLATMEGTSLGQIMSARFASCIFLGIFMAYCYIKTHNLWLCILAHGIYNAVYLYSPVVFGLGVGKTSWPVLGIWILIHMSLFSPFLLSKVIRKQSDMEMLENTIK